MQKLFYSWILKIILHCGNDFVKLARKFSIINNAKPMNNKFIPTITFLLFFLFSFNSFADHEPLVWGEIDEAHLQMTEYEADPDASVLYLGDYAEIFGEDVDYNSYTAYKYVMRIKILTEEGREKYASQKIGYFHGSDEEIKYVEAIYY